MMAAAEGSIGEPDGEAGVGVDITVGVAAVVDPGVVRTSIDGSTSQVPATILTIVSPIRLKTMARREKKALRPVGPSTGGLDGEEMGCWLSALLGCLPEPTSPVLREPEESILEDRTGLFVTPVLTYWIGPLFIACRSANETENVGHGPSLGFGIGNSGKGSGFKGMICLSPLKSKTRLR
jgi:hypothetical protein